MLSAGLEMPLWICEGSHRSVRVVLQNWMREVGRASVVRLVTVHPYSVVEDDEEIYHAGPAWSDRSMTGMRAAYIVRYYVYFVREGFSFPDDIHFFPDIKPKVYEVFLRRWSEGAVVGIRYGLG